MAYIKVQNIKINDEGDIISGTASICETIYDSNVKGKCRHEVREKLGKVLYITEDKKEGIFLSPTRGLVSYNVNKDEFSRVKEDDSRLKGTYDNPKPEVHKVFGDTFLLLEIMKKSHLTEVLREVFPKEDVFISIIIHVLYTILRDRSGIALDDYISKSFLSCIVENSDSILEEEELFKMLGGYDKREEDTYPIKNYYRFLKTFIKTMKRYNPSFGESHFVQEVTLQSIDIYNPYPNINNHQKEHIYYQEKMLMIIDQETGIPVWYESVNWRNPWDAYLLIQGSARELGCSINTYKLDTTYVTLQLFQNFFMEDRNTRRIDNSERKTVIVWVPETEPKQFREIRKKSPSELGEYPYNQLLNMLSNKIGERCIFRRYSHKIGATKGQLNTFVKDLDSPLFIYNFFVLDAPVKWYSWWLNQKRNMTKAKMEVEQWKIGGIVLLSNKSCEPPVLFDEYFRWNKSKEALRQYLGSGTADAIYKEERKEDSRVVGGKTLLSYICLIVRQMLVDLIHKNSESLLKHINCDRMRYIKKESSLSILDTEQLYDEMIQRAFGKLQSLMCFERNGRVIIETPTDEVEHIFSDLGIKLSSYINLKDYIGLILDR